VHADRASKRAAKIHVLKQNSTSSTRHVYHFYSPPLSCHPLPTLT